MIESTLDVADHPEGAEPTPHVMDPYRIVHKDQDQISAFCLNQVPTCY